MSQFTACSSFPGFSSGRDISVMEQSQSNGKCCTQIIYTSSITVMLYLREGFCHSSTCGDFGACDAGESVDGSRGSEQQQDLATFAG